MTNVLPTIVPALPAAPIDASLATIGGSFLVLPLAFVVALVAGLLVERAYVLWRGGSRQRRVRRAFPVIALRRAA